MDNFFPDCTECGAIGTFVRLSPNDKHEEFKCLKCDVLFTPEGWHGFQQLTRRQQRAWLFIENGDYSYDELTERFGRTRASWRDAYRVASERMSV